MLQQLEIRKRIVQRNCLVITSNSLIIPSMVFKQLSELSKYVQSYYMPTSFQMYLDIETNFKYQLTPCLEFHLPGWNNSLVEYILHLFTSQVIFDRTLNHAIYTTCNYARHLKSEEYLTHLAYLFQEGISLTPDLDASKLYHNMAYAAGKGSSFFAPYVRGSCL